MPLQSSPRSTAPCRRPTEWLLLAAGLLSSGLILAGALWNQRHAALAGPVARAAERLPALDLALTSPVTWVLFWLASSAALLLARTRRVASAALARPEVDAAFRVRHRPGRWIRVQARGRVVGQRGAIGARQRADAGSAPPALHDGPARLPDQRLLLDRLGHALAKTARDGGHGALLLVALDDLETLGDGQGRAVGERLRHMVASRLRQVTRDIDIVARLGCNRFALLLQDLGADALDAGAHAELVARKTLNTLGLAYTLDGQELRSTPAIGIALFAGTRLAAPELLRHADLALDAAQAGGGAAFRFFDPGMQAAVDAATSLDADLRCALARREFELWYQPVVSRTGLMTGAEALLRWRRPRHGLTGPDAFIAQAERSGLIVDIGDWVLREACRQLAVWSRDRATAHLTIAVNVSARQFRQDDFVARVLALLAASGADPRRLKLELTESMLLTDVEDTVARMQALRGHGIGIALDDFGTGYSSLSYLQRLPLDQLKIDQSFVRDLPSTPHAAGIVQAIVTLAATLGLQVVAEGVETGAQWDRLREIGCDGFQGSLFAPALAPADMAALLEPAPEPTAREA